MSFILDALRKSERQRDKGSLPTRLDAPATRAATSRLPLVLGVVGGLLAVNVVVLLVVLLRPAAAPREAAARGPAAAPVPPLAATQFNNATAAGDRPAVPAVPAVRPLETEAEEGTVAAALEPPPLRAGGARVTRVTRAPADDSTRPAAFGRGATAQARDGGATGMRSLDELPPQATAGLPRLNIDLHVYGPDAAQRFVVLNGRRYHEGERLQEGPTLERVTPDGAILNHHGLRFLLPRQ